MPPKGSKRKSAAAATKKATKRSKGEEGEAASNGEANEVDAPVVSSGDELQTPPPEKFNLKITCWNVGGIRACFKKGLSSFLKEENADIICMQEVKCSPDKMPKEADLEGYERYMCDSKKAGYAGVVIYSKTKPREVKYGLGIEEHDTEGRVITAEYNDFYLVNTYVPNAGRGLVRLDYRRKWNQDFLDHLMKLDAKKPVVVAGDMNVAHKAIDLKNPKTNEKTAGFTKEEREDMTTLLSKGFLDSFRVLYPNKPDCYTFWSYFNNARAKNVGWRLDYFILSEKLKDKLVQNQILSKVMGSDHCPIALYMSL